jgi:hypothetical protein
MQLIEGEAYHVWEKKAHHRLQFIVGAIDFSGIKHKPPPGAPYPLNAKLRYPTR